jgi:glutathione S-transferase
VSFYPERYTADPAGAKAVAARAASALANMRAYLDGELTARGPHLLGARFSSADLFLFMLTRWGRRAEPKWWDATALGAHFRRIWERPAVRRMWEQEGLEPWSGAP